MTDSRHRLRLNKNSEKRSGGSNGTNRPHRRNPDRKPSLKHALKIIGLFLIILMGGVSVSLIQAGLTSRQAFWGRVEFLINFANPYQRFVHIYPGMRREEIVEKYAEVLNWNDADKRWFIASAPPDPQNGGFQEGYFLSKSYIVDKDASGKEVGAMMHKEFMETIAEKVIPDTKKVAEASGSKTDTKSNTAGKAKTTESEVINLDTAITIASIIQREAAGPEDMKLISGIIWNRIFKGMSLDMDATLQYAKGSEEDWWPRVQSKDKFIDSPYNTYKHKGIPPGAISNPSIDAINAAYHPQKTDCLFYLHDKNRKIHCAKTYEEHKANVEKYL